MNRVTFKSDAYHIAISIFSQNESVTGIEKYLVGACEKNALKGEGHETSTANHISQHETL